jgi:hypothetical protein
VALIKPVPAIISIAIEDEVVAATAELSTAEEALRKAQIRYGAAMDAVTWMMGYDGNRDLAAEVLANDVPVLKGKEKWPR